MNIVALKKLTLYSAEIESPVGRIVAIADSEKLYCVAFADQKNVDPAIKKLLFTKNMTLTPGTSAPLKSLCPELTAYFNGSLTMFTTPIALHGTPFQQNVWNELVKIPYGQTQSYKEIAQKIGNEQACRAVAQANAHNPFVIVVPCHRVIAANGNLSGYNGGITRKQWLLEHEKKISLV